VGFAVPFVAGPALVSTPTYARSVVDLLELVRRPGAIPLLFRAVVVLVFARHGPLTDVREPVGCAGESAVIGGETPSTPNGTSDGVGAVATGRRAVGPRGSVP
jgi:hypothetical protein